MFMEGVRRGGGGSPHGVNFYLRGLPYQLFFSSGIRLPQNSGSDPRDKLASARTAAG